MYLERLDADFRTAAAHHPADYAVLHAGSWSGGSSSLSAVTEVSRVPIPRGSPAGVLSFSGDRAPPAPGVYTLLYIDGGRLARVMAASPPFVVAGPLVVPIGLPRAVYRSARQDAPVTGGRLSGLGLDACTVPFAHLRQPVTFAVRVTAGRPRFDKLVLCRAGVRPGSGTTQQCSRPLAPDDYVQRVETVTSALRREAEAAIAAATAAEPSDASETAARPIGEILIVTFDATRLPPVPGLYCVAYVPEGGPAPAALPPARLRCCVASGTRVAGVGDLVIAPLNSAGVADVASECMGSGGAASTSSAASGCSDGGPAPVPEPVLRSCAQLPGAVSSFPALIAALGGGQPYASRKALSHWAAWGDAFAVVGPLLNAAKQPTASPIGSPAWSPMASVEVRGALTPDEGCVSNSGGEDAVALAPAGARWADGLPQPVSVPRGLAPHLPPLPDHPARLDLAGAAAPPVPGSWQAVYLVPVPPAALDEATDSEAARADDWLEPMGCSGGGMVRLRAYFARAGAFAEVARSEPFFVRGPSLFLSDGTVHPPPVPTEPPAPARTGLAGLLFGGGALAVTLPPAPELRLIVRSMMRRGESCLREAPCTSTSCAPTSSSLQVHFQTSLEQTRSSALPPASSDFLAICAVDRADPEGDPLAAGEAYPEGDRDPLRRSPCVLPAGAFLKDPPPSPFPVQPRSDRCKCPSRYCLAAASRHAPRTRPREGALTVNSHSKATASPLSPAHTKLST